jgi:hypothetical protein
MRVPQHSRCQGWLGSPLVALGAGDEPVDHMLPNQSPAPAGPVPQLEKETPPSLWTCKLLFFQNHRGDRFVLRPSPFPIPPPFPLPRPV